MHLQFILIGILIIISIDVYYFRAVNKFIEKLNPFFQKIIKISYWTYSFCTIIFLFFIVYYFISEQNPPKFARIYIFGTILIILLSKTIGSTFIFIHDLASLFLYIKRKLTPKKINNHSQSRRQFIKKTAIVASILPFTTLMFGVLKSAFDFRVRKQKLSIPNLPKSFKGIKIVQISDIHIGSFISDEPLKEVVQLIKEQEPDIIFFTGDFVNEIAEEALPFINILKQITAPLGVFSVLGNHDYGDYFYQKNDIKAKKRNYDLMKSIHKKIGWKLLLNENHILTFGEDRLAILGVENWGGELRFQKFGDVDKAKKGCLDSDVKLLLSHDPSHWDERVIPYHSDIAVTFSGHTHGMQFGVEIPGFKWSPSKYLYPKWAGLYKSKEQLLYVNRGLGFIGYPGRVGILPEITVFTLFEGL
jgi:predicted MPP superfamily phosphohydrolase